MTVQLPPQDMAPLLLALPDGASACCRSLFGRSVMTPRQVCLLIDFENLVYGLQNMAGDRPPEDALSELDVGLLFKLSEGYGTVVLANAYADWRYQTVNQFQIDLYQLGIDLVQVMGKRGKNAVDVKMAVDAVEILWSMEHIDTFIVVTGDRDFIPVLKAIRRRGKQIIGVAPERSTSDDFAALCDRFVRYSALAATHGPGARPPLRDADHLDPLRSALRRVLESHGEGLLGAKIKPLLRRELSPTFDESEYGFKKMLDLLRSLPEVVRLEVRDGAADVLCFPVDVEQVRRAAPVNGETAGALAFLERDDLIRGAELDQYRFEPRVKRRWAILRALHRSMSEHNHFTFNQIFEQILDDTEDDQLSLTVLSKYQAVLWQARSFEVLSDQNLPVRQRQVRLLQELEDFHSFRRHYESSIVYKVRHHFGERIGVDNVLDLLGFPADDEAARTYCTELIEHSRRSTNSSS